MDCWIVNVCKCKWLGYELNDTRDRGSVLEEKVTVLFSIVSQLALRPTQTYSNGSWDFFFLGVKQLLYQLDLLPPPNAKLKMRVVIKPLPHMPSWCVQGQLHVTSHCVISKCMCQQSKKMAGHNSHSEEYSEATPSVPATGHLNDHSRGQ